MHEVQVSIRNDFNRLRRTLSQLEGQHLSRAMIPALNRTAFEARKDLAAEMQRVFDRPTPATLRSPWVEMASDAQPFATVGLQYGGSKSRVPAGRYLQAQILGGPRRAKPAEHQLRNKGILPSGQFIVPTRHADIDRFGNISSGQMVKILSALNAFDEVGYTANSYGRKGRGKRKNEEYFAISPNGNQKPRGGLPPGVYKVRRFALGRAVLPVLAFVKQPNYTKRLDFEGVTLATFQRDGVRFLNGALEIAIRKAAKAG